MLCPSNLPKHYVCILNLNLKKKEPILLCILSRRYSDYLPLSSTNSWTIWKRDVLYRLLLLLQTGLERSERCLDTVLATSTERSLNGVTIFLYLRKASDMMKVLFWRDRRGDDNWPIKGFCKCIDNCIEAGELISAPKPGGTKSSLYLSVEEWNNVVRTNLTGSWLVSKYVGLHMVEVVQEGCIINISSSAGNDTCLEAVPIPKLSHVGDSSDPLEFIRELHKTMDRKKKSSAVYMTANLIKCVGKFRGPEVAAKLIHSTVKNSSIALSNLIGAVEQMAVQNHPVKGFYLTVAAWLVFLCKFTYDGFTSGPLQHTAASTRKKERFRKSKNLSNPIHKRDFVHWY
ncbi:hypothetical protein ACET3Z_006654 [Daucus carota]